MWPILKPFLPILLLILAGRVIFAVLKTQWLTRAGLPEIDRMDGRSFEEKIAFLFRKKGYQVETTPYVGDWGADLVITNNGRRSVVQVKRWKKRVSPRAVQEVVAAKAKYNCQNAMVVTNSYFTQAARGLAKVNGVELWDRERLARELSSVASASVSPPGNTPVAQPVSEASKPQEVHVGDPAPRPRPKCYKCGREMILKENARGKFWACSGFPKCRNTFPVRS